MVYLHMPREQTPVMLKQSGKDRRDGCKRHPAAPLFHPIRSKETSDQVTYFLRTVERALSHDSVKIFVRVREPSQETTGRVGTAWVSKCPGDAGLKRGLQPTRGAAALVDSQACHCSTFKFWSASTRGP